MLAGRYLVEGPGHCGECHTPRNFTGGAKTDQWLAGATAAEGKGVVPNITGGEGGIGGWSEADIVYFLETGFTPDFDSVGGAMAAVQRNMAMLSAEDRAGDRRLSQGRAAASQRLPGQAARAAGLGCSSGVLSQPGLAGRLESECVEGGDLRRGARSVPTHRRGRHPC